MRRLIAALGAAALVAVAVGCNPTQVASQTCLGRSDVLTLTGAQPPYDNLGQSVAADQTVNATDAAWSGAIGYQIDFRDLGAGSSGVCMVGGKVSTSYPDTDLWSAWHDRTGIMSEQPDTQIVDTLVSDEGDGLDFEQSATNWTVRGVRLHDIHDDCLQDDEMNSGLIDDSFFDGCFSGVSAMGFAGELVDGTGNTITISNSLISLGDVTTMSAGTAPVHNGFFKFAGRIATEGHAPDLAITNTVFEADSISDMATLGLPSWVDPATGAAHPYLTSCANDTMVWLGPGSFPKSLPSCFTVTTDAKVWHQAVSTWLAAHPGS